MARHRPHPNQTKLHHGPNVSVDQLSAANIAKSRIRLVLVFAAHQGEKRPAKPRPVPGGLRNRVWITCLALVENSLSDFAFADLAPFPALLTHVLIQMCECDAHASKPDFRFIFTGPFQFNATGEMQQV
jgi:hypothetical protein